MESRCSTFTTDNNDGTFSVGTINDSTGELTSFITYNYGGEPVVTSRTINQIPITLKK